ncbi:MAG: hypothetical protein Q4C63_00615, partial [Eubacteriales bacterium]|nr:hypothetical protein [Eubacteriales bacterium]
ARGWVEENGTWYYYSSDDDYVTDEWKKSGNSWFWLDEDGAMATDQLIEDDDNYYYVNANGAMVTNSWVAIEPDDDDDDEDAPDHYWYYFGSNGKAYKASSSSSTDIKKKSINGKTYGFDSEGKMLYGWVDENGDKLTDESPFEDALYYFGDSDDGAMHTGWLQYMDGSDLRDDYEDLSEIWFYFDTSTGKKKSSGDKTVNSRKYHFDENGVMVSEWGWDDEASTASSTSNANIDRKYYNADTDGHLSKKAWIWAIPSEDTNEGDYEDDTYRWFYADNSGNTVVDQIKKINGKRYVFADDGIMKAGLVVIDTTTNTYVDTVDVDGTDGTELRDEGKYTSDDDGDEKTLGANEILYYFGDEETDGSMKTGKNYKLEFEDGTYTLAFETSGKGMNKKDSSKIYKNGILAAASTDDKYDVVEFNDGYYLVGTSGSIVKKKKYVKDADDNYYAVYGADKAEQYIDGTDLPESSTEGVGEATIAFFSSDDDYAKEKARDFASYGYIKGCVDTEDDKWVSSGNCD